MTEQDPFDTNPKCQAFYIIPEGEYFVSYRNGIKRTFELVYSQTANPEIIDTKEIYNG